MLPSSALVSQQVEVGRQVVLVRLVSTIEPEPAPVEKSLSDIRAQLMERVTPILTAVWPPQLPFQNFDLAFATNGFLLNVQYQGAGVLDPIALNIVTKDLREKLKAPVLAINATLITAFHDKPNSISKEAK